MRPKAQEQGVRQASKQVLSKEWKELERMRRRKWAWAIRKKKSMGQFCAKTTSTRR